MAQPLQQRFLPLAFLLLAIPGRASHAAADRVSDDARLRKPVTVQRARVYLGELVETLAKQSRVRLTVSDAKGLVSGIELSVFVRRRALREVMSALTDLLSHPFDVWEWEAAKSDTPSYILKHQRDPEAAYQAARASILPRWAADLRTFYEIARSTGPEREARAAARPDLFPGGIRGPADVLSCLQPAQIESLLRGADVTFSRSSLPPSIQGALDLGESGGTRIGTGEPPPPSTPGCYVTWDPSSLGPILWLRNESHSSLSVMGGSVWDAAWMGENLKGWSYPRSPEAQSYHERIARAEPGNGAAFPARTYYEWFKAAAEKQDLELIADLVYPRGSQTIRTAWLGATPEQTVLAFVARGLLTARVSGGIHLFRDRTAPVNPRRHLVGWGDIEKLRRTCGRNNGCLDLSALLFLAGLKPDQLIGLSEEFPDANTDTTGLWRPILAFFQNSSPAARAALQSEDGLPFRDTGLVARSSLLEVPPTSNDVRGIPLIESAPRQAVLSFRLERVEAKRDPVTQIVKGPEKRLVWEVRVPGATPHKRYFPQEARKPLKPE